MWFRVNESVPVNTTEANAQETRLLLTSGTIVEWDVGAPDEAANLLKLQVFYHGSQILPFNPGKNIYPSAVKAPKKDNYPLDVQPYELVFKAWNEDDSYPHEYWVDVTLLREEELMGTVSAPGLVEKIRDFFSGIASVFFGVF